MSREFASADLTAGQLNDIVNKLGGPRKALIFLRGETIFTTKLGTGLTDAEAFREALKKGGHGISDWGNNIIDQPSFQASIAKEATDVDLVVLSVAELGFKDGARYTDICQQAIDRGLMLCPAEVGPQLRLQYQDQPKGERLIIAMEAISDSDGDLLVFCVECREGFLLLDGHYGNADQLGVGCSHFVFLRRK